MKYPLISIYYENYGYCSEKHIARFLDDDLCVKEITIEMNDNLGKHTVDYIFLDRFDNELTMKLYYIVDVDIKYVKTYLKDELQRVYPELFI